MWETVCDKAGFALSAMHQLYLGLSSLRSTSSPHQGLSASFAVHTSGIPAAASTTTTTTTTARTTARTTAGLLQYYCYTTSPIVTAAPATTQATFPVPLRLPPLLATTIITKATLFVMTMRIILNIDMLPLAPV